MDQISIRQYLPSVADADATRNIFLRAIREVAAKDYSAEQINAWAQVDDPAAWAVRRASRPTWIAEIASVPAGFADLVPDGYLDMMFVDPDLQGRGVASRLLMQVEQTARQLRLSRLYTEASLTARPFFEKRGFRILRSQTVEKRGQTLTNFLMDKSLDY